MAFTDQTNLRNRPGAVAGVIAIHAAIGYVLVTGLSFSKIIEAAQNPQAILITPDPLETPLPPPPDPAADPVPRTVPLPYTPPAKIDINTAPATIDSSDILLPPIPDTIRIVPIPGPTARPGPTVTPSAKPSLDPVAARPGNNPGNWVTQNDYRSSWINRGLTGKVSFKVSVGTNGRVTDCTVTRSSGHSQLDDATCANITRRARFEPARNAQGDTVAGSYASTVEWRIPD